MIISLSEWMRGNYGQTIFMESVKVGVRCFVVTKGNKWVCVRQRCEGRGRGSASGLWLEGLWLGLGLDLYFAVWMSVLQSTCMGLWLGLDLCFEPLMT